jgi:hypothetical protein
VNEYYIKTLEIVREESNDDGETTYFIRGEISKNGKKWEECTFVWNGVMKDE